ncbi:protein SSUH2 homolog isoform X2 [Micropterus salmoides]|uniref:protein SSUH2 homolog isoform X2 n=1 Tax=Micropterus salmoides TaxID=27706 RepID=UPI0018EC05A3|nr:protein SSUH2 homolog isoform X2 [Micropterus salmoides]
MKTLCVHLPLPTTPNLNSTGTLWCPMLGSPQSLRMLPETPCSSLSNQNGGTAQNLPGTSPSKNSNPSLCTGIDWRPTPRPEPVPGSLNPTMVVDGPQYGMSPPPWDIPVSVPLRYTDVVEKVRVPHSSLVKPCHKCNGYGRTRCMNCQGRGQKRCTFCHGHGRSRNKRCTSCHGRGRKRCFSCHGQGYRTCSVCHGSQNLLHFIQLTVTWKNDIADFIPDRQPDFPDKKFEKVTGDPFFVDENVLVYPIQGFPDEEICDVSTKMINEHLNRFGSTSRILQQRQTIELVPLTHAYYTYSGKDYSFFVYGMENKVFTAKYPSACTIL